MYRNSTIFLYCFCVLKTYLIVKKIYSKWIKDLNISPETIKLLEQNLVAKLLDIDLGNGFLDLNPKAKTPKSKTNEWNYIKLKRFCTAENKQFFKSQTNKQEKKKKPTNKLKRQSVEREKVFQTMYLIRI